MTAPTRVDPDPSFGPRTPALPRELACGSAARTIILRRRNRVFRIGLAAVLGLTLLSATASAQTAEQRAACEGDFKKYCAGVQPGGGRVAKCLADNKDKISEACRKALKL